MNIFDILNITKSAYIDIIHEFMNFNKNGSVVCISY